MIFFIRPYGPHEMLIEAENPQEAFDKYTAIASTNGFQIFQALGGSGKAGEQFPKEPAPNIIIPSLMRPPGV